MIEQIWVDVQEGAKRTGYNVDHVRRLARENSRLPENKRLMRVRKESHAYEIWLPDLVNYVERRIPYTIDDLDLDSVEKTWVNTAEAAEYTGYNRGHLSLLGMRMWNKPENEREIKTRKRSSGYEMWLPDLVIYTNKIGRGPQGKRKTAS